MTGLALHADPTCVPFFRHDGKQVGAAWGVGRTWSGAPCLCPRKDSSVMVMTDITEELNAVEMRSFTHRVLFFSQRLAALHPYNLQQ